MELFNSVKCDDYESIESKNGYDALLWCTSSQLDEANCSFSIEEIKK